METAALILFFVIASLLFRFLTPLQLKYVSEKRDICKSSKRGRIISISGLTALSILTYYSLLYVPHICSLSYVACSVIISLLLFVHAYIRSSKYADLPKLCRLNCVVVPFTLCALLDSETIFLCRWIFPDVTTVSFESGRYEVSTGYDWPFANGFMPTDSYVVNGTGDTLYRVVVSYAFLGEEVNNHYNVTDTIAPMTTALIPCPPNFVGRSIFPIMMPSYYRFGRIRSRYTYIVNGKELAAFESGDFRNLGIKANIRVHSFNITSNPTLWVDPERISILEHVINDFSKK